jgi:hypothetical protein
MIKIKNGFELENSYVFDDLHGTYLLFVDQIKKDCHLVCCFGYTLERNFKMNEADPKECKILVWSAAVCESLQLKDSILK